MNKSGYSSPFIKAVLLSVFLGSGYSISNVYADVHVAGNAEGVSVGIKKNITGTVIDKDGEPVIGANVVESGTTNGTITGIDGTFTAFSFKKYCSSLVVVVKNRYIRAQRC